jgi:glyoxylase-like metal-dependent hydrolase (beta-lactamase superfamily II)
MTRYHWQILKAGPLKLDGGSMFGVVPRAVWSRSVTPDEQGRIELGHNCVLLSSLLGAERVRGETSTGERRSQAQPSPTPPHPDDPRLAPHPRPLPSGEREYVLIETGSGDKFDEKNRKIFGLSDESIITSLAAVGVSPESLKHVIVSHLHFDHAGGVTRRGETGPVPTFPNATIHVQRREWDDARANRSAMTRTYLPENLRPIEHQVKLYDTPLPFLPGYVPDREELPKLSLEEREEEILPGIFVFRVPGHTWGQHAVRFTNDAGRQVVFTPDIVPTIHHAGAAYNMAYDVEPYMSTVNRRWFLKEAADRDWLLVLDHEPGDPRVEVEPDGKGWFKLTVTRATGP